MSFPSHLQRGLRTGANLLSSAREKATQIRLEVSNLTPLDAQIDSLLTHKIPYGPETAPMLELAARTQSQQETTAILRRVFHNLSSAPSRRWRTPYKGLVLIQYLLINGSEHVLGAVHRGLFHISTLTDFAFIDSNGKDCGINVRTRAEKLLSLIRNEAGLAEERATALRVRERPQWFLFTPISPWTRGSANTRDRPPVRLLLPSASPASARIRSRPRHPSPRACTGHRPSHALAPWPRHCRFRRRGRRICRLHRRRPRPCVPNGRCDSAQRQRVRQALGQPPRHAPRGPRHGCGLA
eukprot:gnl/Ergobibamus_cyprinoides/1554.p2 GENE.gnl/Ergobibamus_cyprinoides/1554~~gnl/Ergobibamus_cyprinoides/1554.p2  ORF type:complete len:297 (+),score=27.72 gnl/Ergobibamus_cyprinoides/1554:101-991(+)